MTFLERLDARMRAVGSCLCLGIDPDPSALPHGFQPDPGGVERFARLLVEAGAPYAAAVKVNLAFFEAFGSAGLAALERVRAGVPADVPFIADAKRGDIGSTAARHAAAIFDALGADAVTANPYLGRNALEPFLERADRFTYVLCRTSNPAAAEVQDLVVDGEPIYLRVARLAAVWGGERANLGLVVGATAPDEMARIRAAVSRLPLLVPGVGAQGGDLSAVLEYGPATGGDAAGLPFGGLLVNVSRGIAQAALGGRGTGGAGEVEAVVASAARDWSTRLSDQRTAGRVLG